MNYGYAHRLVLFNNLKSAIKEVFGKDTAINLIWDCSHDSIQETGSNDWISRRGAGRKYPFKPAIIGGNKNINSALCMSKGCSNELLDSYDHGSGNIETRHPLKTKKTATRLLKWNVKNKSLMDIKEIPHKEDITVKQVVKKLEDKKILTQIAELIPIANLRESSMENPYL